MTARVSILPGRNLWLLARTDRDAPSADSAVLTAAAWLSRLFDGTPVPPLPMPGSPPGVTRYNLGPARPVDLLASQERPALGKGLRGWNVLDQPEMYAVRAQNPWWVLADFDWRGQSRDFETWPTRTVGPLGWASDAPSMEADWLLIGARHMGQTTRNDTTWTEETAKTAAPWVLGPVALLALLYFAANSRSR